MNPKLMIKLLILLLTTQVAVGQNDLSKKMMMGYQGWFLTEGDGSGPNEWRHWSHRLEKPNAGNLHVDMWPDMSEYTTTYDTDLHINGEVAKVFSSHDYSTTKLHFEWMRDYNVHGVYLQRFLAEIKDRRFFEARNHILGNVIQAAAETGRKFALMYDITDCNNSDIYEQMVADWTYVKDNYAPFDQAQYARQEGKPVIAIWGFGFDDGHHDFTNQKIADIIAYFKAEGCYIVGGVHGNWRTGDGLASNHDDWGWVYEQLDMITPWSVGSYGTNADVDAWQPKIIADQHWCKANGRTIDYMPVIWPGFSWSNRYPGKVFNQIPRRGGDFYWHQAFKAIEAEVDFLYGAMFDELDESTAMFKMAAAKDQLPDQAEDILIALNQESQEAYYPTDWYLQLADQVQLMLEGSLALTPSIPIDPAINASDYFSSCDQLDAWTSSGSLSRNTQEKMQGTAALEFTGSATEEFRQVFAQKHRTGLNKENAQLNFWYYIDDVSQLQMDGQIEIGSAGKADESEYYWRLSDLSLQNGWNAISLEVSAAFLTNGGADLNALNWFRIYSVKSGSVTTRIDGIRLVNKLDLGASLDPCDELSTWLTSGNSAIHINTADQREGEGCLQFDGSGTVEFSRVWTTPVDANVNSENGYLKFWYYVNDISKINGDNQIEIGSGAKADHQEYHWRLTDLNLTNGWNKVVLPLATASITDGPVDLTAINWFRIYAQKSGVVKTIVDDIRFEANPSVDNFRELAEPEVEPMSMRAFPNPVTGGQLYLQLPKRSEESLALVKIFDLNGKEMLQKRVEYHSTTSMDISHLHRSGIYLLIVQYDGKVYTNKILIR
ncbi:T9SS type A sorting domain-containing protein [Persicobacter diffluens]|uniref:Secretion system C-terminal sorting domain-containing protein n=1 Tax=Persicobacter diffluens TaxID=981 RepID=A0AAN4W1Z6_9BACT|nr:hypothetical protein PEDI_37930 [Persicobacter diffluens]